MKSLVNKLLCLIDGRIKRRLCVLGILCMVTTLLDSFSIVLVFSLFKVIIQPAAVDEVAWLGSMRDLVAPADLSTFIVVVCLSLLALFLFKGVLQLLASWLRLRIEWIVRAEVATLLLDRYLRRPYRFHIEHSSNELVRNVHSCSSQVSMGVLSIADLFSDSMLLIWIGAVLLLLEPVITVIAFAILGALGVLYLSLGKQYFQSWGLGVNTANENMYRAVLEPLSGIKQVKALGAEPFFTEGFRRHADLFGAANLRNAFAHQALKPVLETLLIAGLLIPVTILAAGHGHIDYVVPVLIMFGAGAYRLMPSAIRIVTTWQSLRFSQPGIEIVHRDLTADIDGRSCTSLAADNRPRCLERYIELQHIGFSYDDAKTSALNDISLVINRGQSVGLVGASGAGKTTLADIILGLLDPTSGKIIIDGKTVLPGSGVRTGLFGYVPQDSFLINDTAIQNVALGSRFDRIDNDRVQRALNAASLSTFFRDRTNGIDAVLGDHGIRLSGGQRQRLAIARALYHDPDILVLDEATSSLDSVTESEIADAIQRLRGEKTLIIIAHRLSTVRNCDMLFYLKQGRLVDSGSFESLIESNPDFREMANRMKLIEEVGTDKSSGEAASNSVSQTFDPVVSVTGLASGLKAEHE